MRINQCVIELRLIKVGLFFGSPCTWAAHERGPAHAVPPCTNCDIEKQTNSIRQQAELTKTPGDAVCGHRRRSTARANCERYVECRQNCLRHSASGGCGPRAASDWPVAQASFGFICERYKRVGHAVIKFKRCRTNFWQP